MIKVEKITKQFGIRTILANVDIEIPKGELLILTGPSGNGKTTLLRIIAGFEVPDQGSVYINGAIATSGQKIKIQSFGRNIGMVFQDFALWPHMTAEENISYGLKSKKLSKNEINDRVEEISNIFRIEELNNRYPSQLSGGEKQRIALARAFVLKPNILLLDEPMSNIDRTLKIGLLDYLGDFRIKNETTIVYVTHSQTDLQYLKGKILVLENGNISNVN